MTKKLFFKFAVTLLPILLLCNLTQGVGAEEEKFYLFEGADFGYLTKVRGPDAFFVKHFFWFPGSSESWETTLLGDIAGEKYGIGIFLASFSTTKFRLEFIVEQDGGEETILASDFVTASSRKFVRLKRELVGKNPQTRAGDKLILRISHVRGGGGAVLYSGGPGDDSYITVPPIVAIKSDSPLAGKWNGTNKGEDGGVISFVITGDRKFVRDFTIRTKAPSQGNGNAIEVEEKIEDAIKIKHGIFRIEKGSLSVEGTFTSETKAVGTWVYSADLGKGIEGLFTAAGTWMGSFDSMTVSPKSRLVTTWGKVKKGL